MTIIVNQWRIQGGGQTRPMPPLTNRDTPPVHCNAALLQALDLLYVTPDTWHFFYCAFERSVGTFVQRSVRTAFSSCIRSAFSLYSVQFVHSFSVQFVHCELQFQLKFAMYEKVERANFSLRFI